jgi:putative ABC transport system permease protein
MNAWFDLKYAWRLMLNSPGHSALCIVVVALSIGLALCTYTLVHAMALKKLPFPDTESWYSVQVAATATATPWPRMDAYTYREMIERTRSVEYLGAFANQSAVLSEGQASTSLRATLISPRLLGATRVAPFLGRLFDVSEGHPHAARVAIISYDTWRTYFAADPDVIGKLARIDAEPVQVIGVLPRGYFAFQDTQVWFPLQLQELATPGSSAVVLSALIRALPGQDPATLLPEMQAVVHDVNRSHPTIFDAGRHVVLVPAHLMETHQNLEIVGTTVFIALSVLLLGTMNISMVFLARLLERSRELALRTALGATRARVLRQCLVETVLVVFIGTLLGYALADLGVKWMQSVDAFGAQVQASGRSANLPEMRTTDFLVAMVFATLVWVLSTVVPAWRVSRQDATQVLAGGSKGTGGPANARSVGLLVGLQVLVSCLVLVVCANLVFAVRNEAQRPTGIDSTRVLFSTYATVFDARYEAPEARLNYWEQLSNAISGRLTNAKVAYTTATPTRPPTVPAVVEGREGTAGQGTFKLRTAAVSDDYFDVLGIELRAGRLFDRTDTTTTLPVAVIDESTARRYWPNEAVIGKRVQLNPDEKGPWLTIIGVVSPVRRPYDRDSGLVYRSIRQAAPGSFHLVAAVPAAATDSRAALRAAAFTVDRDLPLHNLQWLADYLGALNLNFSAMIPAFTVVTLLTVVLAATGLFGLISRSVARRTQEVGIRRALGSTQWQVFGVFLRQGAVYASIGLAGLALGLIVLNSITASIPNVLVLAAPVTLGVFALMALVVFVASWLPSRRATAMEPGDALRYE